MIASFLIQAHSRRGGYFPAKMEGDLWCDAGWTGFKGWQGSGEVAGEALGVLVKEVVDAVGVLGSDDEADMMALVEAPDDLWVMVGRGVRVFLAGQCDDDSCIVLPVLRQLIGLLVPGNLDRGPLAPEVYAWGFLDQLQDI